MLKTVDEALAAMRAEISPLGVLEREAEKAHGYLLAESVLMHSDSPPFDRALVDGFAVRSADASVGAILRIIGRQDAGGSIWQRVPGVPLSEVSQGTCVAINTGAVVPRGVDAVLMVEQSEREGEGIKVLRAVRPEEGIQRRGAQARAGSVALPVGHTLTAAALAAGIAAGASTFSVWRKPRVAVLSTGDELVAPGNPLGPGQIHNSNQPMLRALVQESGCDTVNLGTCGDEREDLHARLTRGLTEADVLIITGGMSMGTRDLVPPLLKELGVRIHVEKVRMKPGKPFIFGTLGSGPGKKYVAGLPGNPVSAFVTFHLFVREMLERLGGGDGSSRWITAEAGSEFDANGDREFFQPCNLKHHGTRLIAQPLAWRGSGDIFSLSSADGVVHRPANAPSLPAGTLVNVLPF
jgi:molybdopterin molybdotransferase